MPDTKKILLTLRPADYYFFGGEQTFDDSDGVRNYFVRSNHLPQQTALVGLLRYILLKAQRDYGDSSFDPQWTANASTPNDHQTYGDLHSVSPLFLQEKEGEERRFLLPGDQLWHSDGQRIDVDFAAANTGHAWTGTGDLIPMPHLTYKATNKATGMQETHTYSEKVWRGDFWVDLANRNVTPTFWDKEEAKNGIFISSVHIGIDKSRRMRQPTQGGEDMEAFYKQEFYRLNSGYCFACVATVDKDVPLEIFQTAMPFGGEHRTFVINAEDWSEDLQKMYQPERAYDLADERITLLSDAYLTDAEAVYAACRLVVAKTRPFRNIIVKTKAVDSATFYQEKAKKRLQLLERGSILFPKPGQQSVVAELLDAAANYTNIGYNHYYPRQNTK